MAHENVIYFYAAAANYADAATLIHDNPKSSGREGLILPTNTLIGLAIELLHKAIFLHNSGQESVIKQSKVRHNLKRLRQLNHEKGFDTNIQGIDEIIDHIGDNYAAHEYRYMKPHSTLNKINGSVAAATVQKFVDEVAIQVGIPVRPHPQQQ